MSEGYEALAKEFSLGEKHTGSLSVVIKGYDKNFDRDVAIKVPNESVLNNEKSLEKFLDEARMLGKIDHPNVISAYELYKPGEIDNRYYLVTEWLDVSLDRVVDNDELSFDSVVFFGKEILKGLSAIHNSGLVHRDIKSSNILVSEDYSKVKIGDLGIASEIDAEETLTATPKYVAPESYALDGAPDRRSDLYSLGILLYELMLGKKRFEAAFSDIYANGSGTDQIRRWINWHLDTERTVPTLRELDPSIPEDFSRFVVEMMSKDVTVRPASAEDAIERLDKIAGSESLSDDEPLPIPPVQPKPKHKLWRWVAVGATTLVLLVVAVAAINYDPGAKQSAVAAASAAFETRQLIVDSGIDTAVISAFADAG